jgi:hypothetical protein
VGYSPAWKHVYRGGIPSVNPLESEFSEKLLALEQLDQQTLRELAEKGEIGPHQIYHPQMREVHEENASALSEMIEQIGWPSISKVGKDAAESAWLIAQHAVSNTEFMAQCADLLEDAISNGDAEGWQLAFLRDRLLTMSEEEQIYGTQFDQDEDGWPIPFPIHDPDGVDERRRKLGLNSLAERISEMREREKLRRKARSKK